MGTTQRISPGVTSQPNWGSLNRAISSMASIIAKEKELDQASDPDPNVAAPAPPTEVQANNLLTAAKAKLGKRRDQRLSSAYNNLIRTGGGKSRIVSGQSRSIGKAGRTAAGRIAGFFSSVGNSSLSQAFQNIGFDNLTGRSVSEALDFLGNYCVNASTGLDDTAASIAVSEVLKEFAIQADGDMDQFENSIKSAVGSNELGSLLCRFWGIYIFEHLAQRFSEAIMQKYEREIAGETFSIIKADIIGRITNLNNNRPIARIDWAGQDGAAEIEKIFRTVLDILSDEN